METVTEEFIGVRKAVKVGVGTPYETEYPLDFEQQLAGVYESQKTWRFCCRQCREAGGTRKEQWTSPPFATGKGEVPEAEQRHQFEAALLAVDAHIELHARMAAWYEMLADSPAYSKGYKQCALANDVDIHAPHLPWVQP
jgi:hypothetical protein